MEDRERNEVKEAIHILSALVAKEDEEREINFDQPLHVRDGRLDDWLKNLAKGIAEAVKDTPQERAVLLELLRFNCARYSDSCDWWFLGLSFQRLGELDLLRWTTELGEKDDETGRPIGMFVVPFESEFENGERYKDWPQERRDYYARW